jgi:proteasome lid subunit RPN8/RPN11
MKPKPDRSGAKQEGPAAGTQGARKTRFPGGALSGSPPVLRVAFDRAPMADLIAHAAATPEVEVGGILVGYLGEDADGRFVHVQAVIRAEQAREQGAHVTFTHETWNHIHGEMDSRHRGQEIVGWYHTHPGFGVFLSEMDTFIHENFFNQPHHVALVFDPLSGRMCMNVLRGAGLVRLDRYWRDGREMALHAEGPGSAEDIGHDIAGLRETLRRIESLAAAPPRRGWIEEWLTPALLLAILALAINAWVTGRESEMTRLKADMFDRLRLLADEGQIRILDASGRGLSIGGVDDRLGGPARPAPPRPGGAGSPPLPPGAKP